jgi:hypothetical protein
LASSIVQEYIDAVRQEGYVLIKQAVAQAVVEDLLNFACNFQYTEDEQASLLRNQQRLNGYGQNVFNVAMKRPDTVPIFIRGVQGEVMKGLMNDKFYAAIPPHLPNYILRSMLLRSSLGAMPYHIDSFIPYTGDETTVVQSILFLNDSKIDNGCTLVVPRSHQTGEYAPQGENPAAIPLEAEAGDIVIWDSRLWHATLENKARRPRWALVGTFCRWYIKQGFDYPRAIPETMFKELDDDEKIVYGYCSYTPVNEFDKTELKAGLDQIKAMSASVKESG